MPTIFVIFGATGDLMAKKVAPALFHLFDKGKFSEQTKIVGFSRRDWSDEQFRDHVRKILEQHGSGLFDKKKIESFLNLFFFQKGFFNKPNDYRGLANFLLKTDKEWGICSNKLFYLAVPPEFYEQIFKSLDHSGLNRPCVSKDKNNSGWTRLIVEKPFGQDLKTARQLDKLLRNFFQENQIYRIDHYLAKEMLQNILSFRLINNFFKNNWGNQVIEKIEIRLLEKIGVEDRGNFYDSIGALRDVGQNHLLQMLALVVMDYPLSLDSENIRLERAKALKQISIPNLEDVQENSFRAQYDGYKKIKGVSPNSEIETYFKIKLFLDGPQWKGVSVTLESGKRMAEVKKEIVITLKHHNSKLIFSLEPEEGIRISLDEKFFHFGLRDKSKVRLQYVEEYEKLLLDCIIGDQTLFVSTEEIETMWSIIDPIIMGWQKNLTLLLKYKPDTNPLLSENDKKIGIIGLGKMGGNIARRLINRGWSVVGFNRTIEITKNLSKESLIPAYSIKELVEKLPSPRIIWLMLPAGEATDEMLFGKEYGLMVRQAHHLLYPEPAEGLISFLKKGDTIVEGGNSFYEDSIRRAKKLKENGINFIDVGVSGGPSGALNGPALMIGGDTNVFHKIEFLFKDLARENGYQFFEGAGAGHFVKMIHNGIEYGMMQALAEGFNVLKNSSYSLDLKKVADIYNNGSVIESRLVGWLKKALDLHGEEMKNVSGSVKHTGEGEWTVKTAKKMRLKAKIIEESFKFRVLSEKNPSYIGKILSALREQFGGHSVK